MTKFPQSWFQLGDAESAPMHKIVCHAADQSAEDEAIVVRAIENVEESLPNEWASFDSDDLVAWYYVGKADHQYGTVIRVFEGDAKAVL